jgi:hypothetical protein
MRHGLTVFVILLLPVCARAQVATLGRGFLLGPIGSVSSAAGEVISGASSIKGAYSGGDSSAKMLLSSNPNIIRLTPNQTFTATVNYRIITPSAGGFELVFLSSSANGQGVFLPGTVFHGAAGSSGTVTLTANIGNYSDVRIAMSVFGPGAIVVDDLRVTSDSGTLIAAENAEGPAMASGGLGFQVTHGMAMLPEADAIVRSAAVKDLDADGYPEVLLTLTAPRPSTTPLAPIAIDGDGGLRITTNDIFPTGAPTVKHSALTLFADLNRDGLDDVVIGDSGSDAPPWPGSGAGIALNNGGGTYRNVSSLIPADIQMSRSYALAVGDIDANGGTEIVLIDQNGSRHALLRWSGNAFEAQRDWLPEALWGFPANLNQHSWTVVADFDRDGQQDLLISGQSNRPNTRILFGPLVTPSEARLVALPDGPYGNSEPSPGAITQGTNSEPVVAADFDNDGRLDLFAIHEQIVNYPPGTFTDTDYPDYQFLRDNGGSVPSGYALQVLMNRGPRTFVDASATSSIQSLGRRKYTDLLLRDMNVDGFVDVVGIYQTQFYAGLGPVWGTTFFLNDGTGAFDVVDGTRVLATTTNPSNGQHHNLGGFVPTVVRADRTEGVVVDVVGTCAVGFCAPAGVNLYKIAVNRAIGTGPGLEESSALGVPGFNEFYYLRRHADAAAAVQRGDYSSGLAHYLAVGRDQNYRPFAPRARVAFTDALLTPGLTRIRLGHIVELRARVNLVRSELGLAPFAFTDPTLAAGQPLKAVHVTELRTAVLEAYAAAGRPVPTFSETVTAGLPVRAQHVHELRDAVVALE